MHCPLLHPPGQFWDDDTSFWQVIPTQVPIGSYVRSVLPAHEGSGFVHSVSDVQAKPAPENTFKENIAASITKAIASLILFSICQEAVYIVN